MYQIKFTNEFKRNYKLIKKRGYDISLLKDIIVKLSNGEKLEEKYRDHLLKGRFQGFHECHIKPDWLLIYLFEEGVLTLTLVATGTHTDVLNM